MESDTLSKNHRNDYEEYPRFNNKIILGSKPCRSVLVTKSSTYDTPEHLQGKHCEETNDNEAVNASSVNVEVCKHCNKVFPDNTVLLKHLLKVATKCNSNDCKKPHNSDHPSEGAVEYNVENPPNPANTLKVMKKHKSLEIDQDSASESDVIVQKNCDRNGYIEKNKLLYKSGVCNEHLLLKTDVPNFTTKNKLKRKMSHEGVASKKFKSKEKYDEEKLIGKEIRKHKDNSVLKVAKLFKCPCGLHYTSPKALQKHFKVCYPAYKMSKQNCSKCGILFPTDLLVEHLCKHHSNDKYKFEVVNVTPNLKMYKCESCHSMFYDKADLTRHFDDCKCDSGKNCFSIASEECSDPLETINKANLTKEKSKKKEATTNELKTSLQKDKVLTNGKKQSKKQCIYKCYKCDIHYLKLPSMRYHFEVKHQLCMKVVPCEFCGLNFSLKSMKNHVYLHHYKLKCQLMDLQIQTIDESMSLNGIEVSDNNNAEDLTDHVSHKPNQKTEINKCKRTTTPSLVQKMEKLYQNKSCPLHFITKHALYEHMKTDHLSKELCRKKSEDCKICGYAFSFEILSQHILEHHFIIKLKREDLRVIIKGPLKTNANGDNKSVNTDLMAGDKKNLPLHFNSKHDNSNFKNNTRKKLLSRQGNPSKMPKTEDLKAYDKHLYKCASCSLHVMKLNTLQKHFTNYCSKGLNSSAADCEICGLKFSSISLKRHIYIHHKKMKLNREDFTISQQLPRAPALKKLHNIESTQEKAIEITEKKKTVKFSEKDNITSKTHAKRLFKCDKCWLHFINACTLQTHSTTSSCNPHDETKKVSCEYCGLKFSPITLSRHKNVHHKRMKLSLKDFEIITKRDIDAQEKRKRGRPRKCIMTSKHGLDTKVSKRGRPKKSLAQSNDKLSTNANDTKDDKTRKRGFKIHQSQEKRKGGRPRKYIMISKHGLDIKVSKRGRPKKSLAQSNDKLSTNAKDTKDDKTRKLGFKSHSLNSKSYNKCLYKCNICLLHFMRESNLNKHLHYCNSKSQDKSVGTGECSICNLNFKFSSLSRHKYVHHIKMKLTSKDFTIKSKPQFVETEKKISQKSLESDRITNSNGKDIRIDLGRKVESEDKHIDESKSDLSPSNNKKTNNCLYKCHTCFLHFMGTRAYYKHMAESAHTEVDAKCDVCGLFFSRNTIKRHKDIHHKILKLKFEDFIIVNQLRSVENKNANKSYNASYQSLNTSVTPKSNASEQPENAITPKSNMESSRNKIKLALESIESSKDDITSLRETISAFSKNSIKSTGDDIQTSVNDSPRNVTSLKEDECSVTITVPSREDMDKPSALTYPSENIWDLSGITGLSKNRRKSTETKIRKIQEDVCSINVTDLLRENMKPTSLFPETQNKIKPSVPIEAPHKLDSLRTIEVLKVSSTINTTEALNQDMNIVTEPKNIMNTLRQSIDVFGRTSAGSSREIDQSFTQSPNNNTLKQNTNVVENGTDENLAEIHLNNNMPSLLTLTRKHNLKDVLKLYNKNLYKCEVCLLYFTTIRNLQVHVSQGIHKPQHYHVCEICNYTFSSSCTELHKDVHHTLLNLQREDFHIVTNHAIPGSKIQKEKENKGKLSTDSKYQVTLFKCGICNVYFIKCDGWIKHTSAHVPLQDKEYTECKLCKFQFTIDSLHKHIQKHHKKDFNFEEVLIEEYLVDSTGPKIQTYCAIDRVQSKLVSTTTEAAQKYVASSENVTEGNVSNYQYTTVPNYVNVYDNKIIFESVQTSPIGDAQTTVTDCQRNEKSQQCDTTNDIVSHFWHGPHR